VGGRPRARARALSQRSYEPSGHPRTRRSDARAATAPRRAGCTAAGVLTLLESIAAAVIGGTSLFGGRGSVGSALFGALVIGSDSNGLDLIGQSAEVKYIVSGAILLLAITIDALSRLTREAARR
jgi:ABC-type xylose transport system permease subunit